MIDDLKEPEAELERVPQTADPPKPTEDEPTGIVPPPPQTRWQRFVAWLKRAFAWLFRVSSKW